MLTPALHPAALVAPAAGARSILLVEDEPHIARMLTKLFSQSGLRVLSAADPARSASLMAGNLEDIAFAFVDFHGTGREASEFCLWVRAIRPNLPLLLATGRGQPPVAIGGPTVLLPRPYLPTELMGKVRDLLSRAVV